MLHLRFGDALDALHRAAARAKGQGCGVVRADLPGVEVDDLMMGVMIQVKKKKNMDQLEVDDS